MADTQSKLNDVAKRMYGDRKPASQQWGIDTKAAKRGEDKFEEENKNNPLQKLSKAVSGWFGNKTK